MVRPTAQSRLSPLQPGLCAKCPVREFAAYSLCVFDKEKFRDLLRQKPQFERELLKHSASSQASRDRRLSDLGRRGNASPDRSLKSSVG